MRNLFRHHHDERQADAVPAELAADEAAEREAAELAAAVYGELCVKATAAGDRLGRLVELVRPVVERADAEEARRLVDELAVTGREVGALAVALGVRELPVREAFLSILSPLGGGLHGAR